MKVTYPPGATPLPLEWEKDLIPDISTVGELNEFEAANILEATKWVIPNRSLQKGILTIHRLEELHRRMFDTVWKWAGQYRRLEMNIGVDARLVRIELRKLCDNAQYWLDNGSFSVRETAVRIHHRMVQIHPWVNGNGRHARLVADLVLLSRGESQFAWGGGDLVSDGERRARYREALRKMDKSDGDFADLLAFADSGP